MGSPVCPPSAAWRPIWQRRCRRGAPARVSSRRPACYRDGLPRLPPARFRGALRDWHISQVGDLDGGGTQHVRITFLSPHLRIAGGVRAILTHADRLAARGHDVTVVVPARRRGKPARRNRSRRLPAWMLALPDPPRW